MKKIIAISALLISSLNAMEEGNQQADQQAIHFRGNWTETFMLKTGEPIVHAPNYIKLGGIQSGKGLHMNMKNYNGLPVSEAGLQLETDSTREEFVKALIASGLYEG